MVISCSPSKSTCLTLALRYIFRSVRILAGFGWGKEIKFESSLEDIVFCKLAESCVSFFPSLLK